MGNQHSRPGEYGSRYPPRQGYDYSKRAHTTMYTPDGGRVHDTNGYANDYAYRSYSRAGYPNYSATHAPQALPYPVVPPPPQSFSMQPPSTMYPVVPPMPMPTMPTRTPPVVPGAGHVPQPVIPMPMPQFPPTGPSFAPVIPPIPQTGTGTPYPMAPGPPVIPATHMPFPQPAQAQSHHRPPPRTPSPPESSSDDDSEYDPPQPRGTQPRGRRLAPGQYGRRKYVLERPETLVFNHHPLPPPPKDVFATSPYVGLLDKLRRTPEEILGHDPQTTGYIVSPVGSYASREKKPRKGLLRALSEKLTGKSRRDREQRPMAAAVVQPVVFAPAMAMPVMPPPGEMYDMPRHPSPAPHGGGQPGATPGLMFAAMQSPSHSPVPPPPPSKSPAPSTRSRAYSPRQEPLRIDFNNELARLTHMWPEHVHYRDRLYPTAFHALEAQRFVDTDPEAAEQVRRCADPDQVRAVVSHNGASTRPDWDQVVLQIMDDVLHHKFIQHPDLRHLLLGTGNLPLQFTHPSDNFWGDGLLGQGSNQLGKSLERVRERLRSEGYTMDN